MVQGEAAAREEKQPRGGGWFRSRAPGPRPALHDAALGGQVLRHRLRAGVHQQPLPRRLSGGALRALQSLLLNSRKCLLAAVQLCDATGSLPSAVQSSLVVMPVT